MITPPGYRLPDATRLGAVRLQVADLERSLAWYRDLLGFRVLDTPVDAAPTPRTAMLGVPGSAESLIEIHERPGAQPSPRGGAPGLYHFAILLPDRIALGSLLGRLAEAGIRAGAADHLVSEAIYLQDPDNLGIEIYADRPRESWRMEGDQLAMASNPLDVKGLVRAAADSRWSGMPPGTVMGHVHLHVGDIEQAAILYHDGIGFDKMVWSYPGALFLAAGGYHHHLGNNTWGARQQPAGEGDARLLEWTIVVPAQVEVAKIAASIEATGQKIEESGSDVIAIDEWGTRVRITAEAATTNR